VTLAPITEESPLEARILDRAAELCEQGWCQNSFALDRRGRPVWEGGRTAVSFCLFGALKRASRDICGPLPDRSLADVKRAFNHHRGAKRTDTRWNDSKKRTQSEVVAALREAARSVV
jgi:hypothetical protein